MEDSAPEDLEPVPAQDEPLSPRHRRLAEMFARGASNAQVREALGYSDSRCSILKNSPRVQEEIRRIQDKIYEPTVDKRLKDLAASALDRIEEAITDKRNKYKKSEQLQVAQWLVEKVDGKAIQKHEVRGSMLLGLMDKLDAIGGAGLDSLPEIVDVTPEEAPKLEASSAPELPKTPEETEEERLLRKWASEF